MSVDFDATIKYNQSTGELEHETVANVFVLDWDYYKLHVYEEMPEFSSTFPITELSLDKIEKGYKIVKSLMSNRLIGSVKFKRFIELVNEIGELI